MSKPTTIYALIDPRDNSHHYIGKTIQMPPQKRLRQHLKTPASDELAQWIDNLANVNITPELKVLETVPHDADWRAAEVYWIRFGISQQWQLKNKTTGGDNYPLDLLAHAKADTLIPRIVYAREDTLRLLMSINCYVMRGKRAENNTFRELLHQALSIVQLTDSHLTDAKRDNLYQHILSSGIIQQGRGWRVPLIKKSNPIGGEFLAVGKPFAINGIGIPGKWDKAGWRTSIKMSKATSELLDTLATQSASANRRRGYDDVILSACSVLASIFDEIAG
ncbi:MAG: hypothetical protein AAFV98_00870 [Chloroflexota bacterium]